MTYILKDWKFYIQELKKLKKLSNDEILNRLNNLQMIVDMIDMEENKWSFSSAKKLELEEYNFKINSTWWKEKKNHQGIKYKVNPEWDITECLEWELKWEQLFSYEAAIRETEKVWKKIPTDEEFDELVKRKKDVPNLPLAGYRNTDGVTFYDRGYLAYLWSSAQSPRYFYSGYDTVRRYTNDAAYGFSVRCLKD